MKTSERIILIVLLLIGLGSMRFYSTYKNTIIENRCTEQEVFYNGECFSIEKPCQINNGNGIQVFSGGTYNDCKIVSCNDGFEIEKNECLPVIRERTDIYTGIIVANSYSLDEYPQIKVNEKIQGGSINMKIDFTDRFKTGTFDNYIYGGTSDGKSTNPAPFGLYFFLGKESVPSLSPWLAFGGFVEAMSYKNGGDLRNTQELNGVVPGNAVVGGYTRSIPIVNNLVVATKSDEWRSDYKFKYVQLLNYINSSIGDKLYIGGFLSDAALKGWELTKIISIEIKYIGEKNAIEFVGK